VLRDPAGAEPRLFLQQVPEPDPEGNEFCVGHFG
jgi:hypothetical protein